MELNLFLNNLVNKALEAVNASIYPVDIVPNTYSIKERGNIEVNVKSVFDPDTLYRLVLSPDIDGFVEEITYITI